MPAGVHVGTVVRPRGNRGEVVVDCPGGHPERFLQARSLATRQDGGAPVGVRRAWLHGGRLVLHLEGIDTVGAAQALVGRLLYLAESELPALPDGSWYTFELVGARVIGPDGRLLGHVQDTVAGAAQDRLVVLTVSGRSVEVPLARAIIRDVDVAAGEIRVDAPEGLLEGEAVVARPEPARRRP